MGSGSTIIIGWGEIEMQEASPVPAMLLDAAAQIGGYLQRLAQ